MLTRAAAIARKELVDHLRDTRSIASSTLYSLMGPAVILLALVARGSSEAASEPQQRWFVMAAVFALMAAFTGAMAAAMDMIAGERERRTLVPLLLTSSSRRDVVAGKWLAASAFAAGGLVINLAACGLVFTFGLSSKPPAVPFWLSAVPALVALAFLVAALEIFVSTLCRSAKEANTYLSILMFATMGIAMWLAFQPQGPRGWLRVVPLAGHQAILQGAFDGAAKTPLDAAVALQLVIATAAATVLVLAAAWTFFAREDMAHGG